MVASVQRAELSHMPVPAGTRSWSPIPHNLLIDQVLEATEEMGLNITKEWHEVDNGGLRYFGKFFIGDERETEAGYNFVLGVRNSNDKTFSAGVCCGSSVLVCSNLCFSGDITLSRKHTRFIRRDLPGMVYNAVDGVVDMREHQYKRIQAYKAAKIGDLHMSALCVRAMVEGVISSSQIGKVWGEWKEPSHSEFESRTVFSAMNAFTEVFKTVNPMTMNVRGQGLHQLCDRAASVLAA